jgi:hypothetical protein
LPKDEEIRILCLRVLQARNDLEFDGALSELRTALSEHVLEAENMGISLILNAPKLQVVTTDESGPGEETEEEKAS